jgi:endonuclease G
MNLRNYKLLSLLPALLLLLTVSACSSDNNGKEEYPPQGAAEAFWKLSSTVKATEGNATILMTGAPGTTWNAEITDGTEWCAFVNWNGSATTTGSISTNLKPLYVYYDKNSSGKSRTAVLTVTFEGQPAQTLTLTQLAESQQDKPSFGAWAEMPAEKSNPNYVYVTHYIFDKNKGDVRNYSICFDKTKRAALWVAYPLHDYYLGSSGRTEAWGYDPMLDDDWQAFIEKSFNGNYDRGHQIPSGDRTGSNEMNAQTFYSSNMTPQLSRLNQDMWAKLEDKVRSNRCSDTLYVVTGAYYGADGKGIGSTTDKMGQACPLPEHYFKVLLRTRSGKSGKNIKECDDSELRSIGFWVEHKSYGNINPPVSICTSVQEIEQKTGFTFFPEVSEAVKSQNTPSDWGIN